MSEEEKRTVVLAELMPSARVIHSFVQTVQLFTSGLLYFQLRHSQSADVVVSKLATA